MELEVIMLGPDGVGKTCYLAALQAECWTTTSKGEKERHWFLELPFEQRRRMVDLWKTITASQDPFPPANVVGRFSEWHYACRVESVPPRTSERFTPVTFTFLDYAGDTFVRTTGGDEFTSSFEERVKRADIVVGLFDGADIFDWMSGAIKEDMLVGRYGNMLMTLQSHTARHPIHFMLTKWDLLESKYTFPQVLNRLMEFGMFREFVEAKRQRGLAMRLIPISSFGVGFAKRDAVGQMQKVGGAPSPQYVEVPLAVLLHDGLKARLTELQRSGKITQRVELALKWAERPAAFIPHGIGTIAIVVASFLLKIRTLFAKRQIKDERTALEAVVEDLELEKRSFDHQFPRGVLIRVR